MHVHHHGRVEYTLITPSTSPKEAPKIERVIVGPNAAKGEQRQLLVGTGVWKMSRLLPEDVGTADPTRVGCLITEVVFPGFHWEDHRYMTGEDLEALFLGIEGKELRIKDLRGYIRPL